jgi:hypothetical protein
VWEFCGRDCLVDMKIGWHDRKQQQYHFLHYGAVILGEDLSIHVLCALWDQRRGNLFLYDAWRSDDPSPVALIPALAKRMHMREFLVTKLLGNDRIFEDKGTRPVARSINETLRGEKLFHHRIKPAVKYDRFGATVDGAQLWKLKRVFVSKAIEEAVDEFQDWMVVKGEASPPTGYCEGLCLILSELRVLKEIERVLKPEFRDYNRKEVVEKVYQESQKVYKETERMIA